MVLHTTTHHMTARALDAGRLLLSPGRLVDWLLDRLDKLSAAMMPAQVEMVPCRQAQREKRFD
jgi:hypothetical protein